MGTEISNSVGEKRNIFANSVCFGLIISSPSLPPPPPPPPQGFHLLGIVLLIGYFAEYVSPPETAKAPHLFPEVVENPKNQSAFIGSNVTFNCTAMGLPTPAISWMKNNDSYAVTSNVRAKVVPENNKSSTSNHSQLIITKVKIEDSGKYQCVANNSAGERKSSAAFLYIKEFGKTPLHCWKS